MQAPFNEASRHALSFMRRYGDVVFQHEHVTQQ
jgi:hypothetical protein